MPDPTGQNTQPHTGHLIRALSLLHGTQDTPDALRAFINEVEGLLQATGVLWLESDPGTSALTLKYFAGDFPDLEEGLVLAEWDSYFQSVLEGGGPQVLEGKAIQEQLPEAVASHPDVETVLATRVGSSDRPHGVLVSLLPGGSVLAISRMEMLGLLGSALDRALNNYLLREELENQVDRFLLLHDLSRILQSDEPLDERLTELVENLTRSFGARFGYIMLFNEEKGILEFAAAHGIDLGSLEHFRIEPGTGITGRVFETGEARLVPDVSVDPDYIQAMEDVVTELATPIIAGGSVIGVLNFESDRPKVFGPDDLRMASIISAQIGTTLQHALSFEDAKVHLAELELLNQVAKAIGTIEELDDLLNTIVGGIHAAYDVTSVGILLREADGDDLEVHAAAGRGNRDLGELKLALGKGITGVAGQEGQTLYVPDVTRDPRYVPADPLIRSELAIPLIDDERVIGILNLESDRLDAFSEEDRHAMEIVGAQIALMLGKALLYDELQRMAITDGLTGLFNHRHFFMHLESEFKRSIRYSYPVSLIMVDIDFFKDFNDAHGHLKGDVALRMVGDLVTHAVRETDVVARYGGEEFAAILPLCHESTAVEVAERLRQTIEASDIVGDGGEEPLTVSVGICTAPQHASTHEELVRRADDAMYASKREGRNRCTLWNESLLKQKGS
jgi:diguanylate cyclase (GGDEF)-like protein